MLEEQACVWDTFRSLPFGQCEISLLSLFQLANPSFRKTSQLLVSKSMMESKARLHAGSRAPRRRVSEVMIYQTLYLMLLCICNVET